MSESATFNEALTLHQSGRIAEAEELYRRFLREQPNHAGALHLLGVVRQQHGDHRAALELIGRAIAVNPNKAVYHNNYGAALQSLARYEEATEHFQRALAIAPNYADALANLGLAQTVLGEDAAAVSSLRAVLVLQPGHADAMRRLASLVQQLGMDAEAVRLYQEALPCCSAVALAAAFAGLPVYGTGKVLGAGYPRADGVPVQDGTRRVPTTLNYDGRNPMAIPSGQSNLSPRPIPPEGGTASARSTGFSRNATAASPLISVIVPVYNSEATIERAVRSLRSQTFSDWEAIVIDDASSDGTWNKVRALAGNDRRIRITQLAENRGPSAARNAGLRLARGEFIAYLDGDDEYYPDYLQQIAAAREKGDVLMFGFDVVYEDGPPGNRAQEWDPRNVRRLLFASNPVVPLAASHRRSLLEAVGGFHELVSQQEDWDLWKRMARADAKFTFLAGKSGLYHVRPGTLSREHRLTAWQRDAVVANWEAGRTIYEIPNGKSQITNESEISNLKPQTGPLPCPLPEGEGDKRIAFVSTQCLLDPSNQPAVAALDAFQAAHGLGIECQAFCGTLSSNGEQGIEIEEMLALRKTPYQACDARIGPFAGRMVFTQLGTVPVTVVHTPVTGGTWPSEKEVAAFVTACERFLKKQRLDAVLTCGDDPVSCEIMKLLKRLDIPIVSLLHDLTHGNAATFAPIDYAVVPSEFARQHYWETLGLACHVLPLLVDPERTKGADWNPRYITFVNPSLANGLNVFSRIAEQLAARRPDIPLLVMAGRSRAGWQQETGIDLSQLSNLTICPSVANPREFYATTRLLLMPSLWNESFGLVAAEAMINGIPVLASNRGALSETIADAGFLFDIPARYTPESRRLPTAEEVEPWVETIIRLWDDRTYYDRWSRAAREHAQLWQLKHLAGTYREFFGNLFPQPGPPLVPPASTGHVTIISGT